MASIRATAVKKDSRTAAHKIISTQAQNYRDQAQEAYSKAARLEAQAAQHRAEGAEFEQTADALESVLR